MGNFPRLLQFFASLPSTGCLITPRVTCFLLFRFLYRREGNGHVTDFFCPPPPCIPRSSARLSFPFYAERNHLCSGGGTTGGIPPPGLFVPFLNKQAVTFVCVNLFSESSKGCTKDFLRIPLGLHSQEAPLFDVFLGPRAPRQSRPYCPGGGASVSDITAGVNK